MLAEYHNTKYIHDDDDSDVEENEEEDSKLQIMIPLPPVRLRRRRHTITTISNSISLGGRRGSTTFKRYLLKKINQQKSTNLSNIIRWYRNQ